MTWPVGLYEPSLAWWKMGEEGRQPVYDAITRLGIPIIDVMSVEFETDHADFYLLHRDLDGVAHFEGHCEGQAVVLHANMAGKMVCSCGKVIGESHVTCVEYRTIAYP